ncbi:glutamine-hydrolyzing GMP synthase [Candidatus Woesearchaeota archaeon]|nr:glutamine-hydrolyzing GMP synthase [Candidatus Woesearchaeota archaeon]
MTQNEKIKNAQRIMILDMGGQYCHLLARRIRQLGVYSEIMPAETKAEELEGSSGIILSGGPSSVYEKDSPQPDKNLFKLKKPILGLCYGHQLMAFHLGGKVRQGTTKEYGFAELMIKVSKGIFSGLKKKEQVWMSHGDEVVGLPDGFNAIGSTDDCKIAAMADEKRNYFGFQFHPEVTHTPNGMKMLKNFINICGCKRNYDVKNYFQTIELEIKRRLRNKKVFLLVSGGVDSTVCFVLLDRILGPKNVYGLFIDNGFIRKNEARIVMERIERLGFDNFHVHDASADFLEAVRGIVEPEEKRRIIGETFISVQKNVLRKLKLNPREWVLAQGTIYPDTIETKGTKNADLIKTHHNRVPLVQEMIEKGLVIEPLKSLYKDEVRELGKFLGLPNEMVWRHPFPGPGLAVRCLCSDGRDKKVDEANMKVKKIAQTHGYQSAVLPIKSVGVQGDARSYKHPAIVVGGLDWDMLEQLSTAITNKVREVNRVLYLVAPKEMVNLKLKKAYLTKNRLDLLREADRIVVLEMKKQNLYSKVWQFPVVIVPIGGESIILRPIVSTEAMTARFARLPKKFIDAVSKKILALGIRQVFYDVTNKPPGTIEWE